MAPALRPRVQIRLGELPADPAALEISGNRQLLGRALANLLDNALKYSGDAPVTVDLQHAAGQTRIRIADQGIGIAEKDLQLIFQPFFRAGNARGVVGHGVGLPLARRIIELHGGQVQVESRLGAGTVAEVTLPTNH